MQCIMILSILTFSFRFLPHLTHHPVPLPSSCCRRLCCVSPTGSMGAAHLHMTVGLLPGAEGVSRHHSWKELTLLSTAVLSCQGSSGKGGLPEGLLLPALNTRSLVSHGLHRPFSYLDFVRTRVLRPEDTISQQSSWLFGS